MKKICLVFMLIVFLLSGCGTQQKVVYLRFTAIPGFTDEELKNYKEITVVDQFSLLEQNLKKPVAIWIDKYAIDTVPAGWLKESPQKDYPIVVLGYNEPVYVFGTLLPVDFPWPARESAKTEPPEGFSVWKRTGEKEGIIKGYSQLEVQKVLEVTNKLLKNQVPD